MTKETKKPAKTFSLGRVRASVWENSNKEGEAFHNISFERSYKDKDGKWHNTNSYGVKDLFSLIRVAAQAARFCQFPETSADEKEAA